MNLLKKKNTSAAQEQSAPEAQAQKKAASKTPEAKRRTRKRVIYAIVALVIVACVALAIWGGPLEVQAETVAAAEFIDSFTETGNVKSGLVREHLSPADGKVAEVLVAKNSAVKAGDVLVRIDATALAYELESHRNALGGYRAQVNERIRSLRAELNELRADRGKNVYDNATGATPEEYLASLQTNLEVARRQESLALEDLNSARELYDIGAESRVAVEEAEKAHIAAQGERAELERRLAEARKRLTGGNGGYYAALDQGYSARIQAAQEELDDYLALAAADGSEAEVYEKLSLGKQIAEEESRIRELENKLERCTVRASCDGYVSELPAATLSDVSEGDLIATVRERGDFKLEVNVLTNEEPFLHVGDAVTLTQKLKGQYTVYEGVIGEIGSYAEKSLSATGAEEYRVRVVVDIAENSGLKDGYELEARFTTYRRDAALSVPNSALFKENGQDCVFVVSGMRAQLRPVEVVHKAAIRTELASGVSAGDRVVTDANVEGLADGALVIASTD